MIKSARVIDEECVKKFNEDATSWKGRCRLCGEELTGTLASLRAHVCKVSHGE